MNRGVPPTARNARTGEFTPPGMIARAAVEQFGRGGRLVGVGRWCRARSHRPVSPANLWCRQVGCRSRRVRAARSGSLVGTRTDRARRCRRSGSPVRPRGSVASPPRIGAPVSGARRRCRTQVRDVDVGQREPFEARRRGRRSHRPAPSTPAWADTVPIADARGAPTRTASTQRSGRDVAPGQRRCRGPGRQRARRRSARTAATNRPARRMSAAARPSRAASGRPRPPSR